MQNLIGQSYIPDEDDVKDIIIIKGMDNLDFKLLFNKLRKKEELEEESEDTFIDIFKEIKENYVAKEESYDFLPMLFENSQK